MTVTDPARYHIVEHGEVFGELNITKEIYARGPIAATIADPCAGPNIYPGESNCAFEEYRGANGPAGTVIPGTGIFNDTTVRSTAAVEGVVTLSQHYYQLIVRPTKEQLRSTGNQNGGPHCRDRWLG